MMDATDGILAVGMIGLFFLGTFVGGRFRGATHSIIPFAEPLSYMLLTLTLLPLILTEYAPGHAFIDTGSLWYPVYSIGFWAPYIYGYLSNQMDVVYVAVHRIVEKEQDIEPLVRYVNRRGQQCWQPQGFLNICKTVFLRIDHPLVFPGGRTRHISMRNVFIRIEADAVDLAGLEVNVTQVRRLHFFTFNVEARKYVGAPQVGDSPYDWFIKAAEYENIFTSFHELQVQAVESRAALQMARVKGGADIYNTLAGMKPQNEIFDQLGTDFENQVEASKRRLRKGVTDRMTAEERQEAAGTEAVRCPLR